DSANTWLNYMNSNDISFIAWSLCNKNETSALIAPWCNKLSGWSDDELSETGRWFKTAIKR
ncbi:MAG: glycoside hydrolase family 5 protein, partial [Lachnospira sp.]|nr:glycoside hydrolase family 5 protein [Lachnospira sp.]